MSSIYRGRSITDMERGGVISVEDKLSEPEIKRCWSDVLRSLQFTRVQGRFKSREKIRGRKDYMEANRIKVCMHMAHMAARLLSVRISTVPDDPIWVNPHIW